MTLPEFAMLQATPGVSIPHFLAGFFLILTFYTAALLFTYWISKDE